MQETTANLFRQNLKSADERWVDNHEVLRVVRRTGVSFVVFGEEDWRSIEETLYLNQVPGLAACIQTAAQESLAEGTTVEDLDW